MSKGQPYIRKKGKGFVIERKVGGRTEYIKTLPPIKEILIWCGVDASLYYEEKNHQKVDESVKKNEASEESLTSSDKSL